MTAFTDYLFPFSNECGNVQMKIFYFMNIFGNFMSVLEKFIKIFSEILG